MNQPEDNYSSPEAAAGARRARWILLGSPIAFLLLLWVGNIFIRWVWQPPIVIEGRVVDTQGKGVPDVFVIVNHEFDFYNPDAPWILAEGEDYSGLTCAPYSRVLQTDNQGRYYLRLSMREAFGDQRYPSLEWRKPTLKFYKPGWQDTYQLSAGLIHSSFPKAPDPFVMQPAATDIEAVVQYTRFIGDLNCDFEQRASDGTLMAMWQRDPSWLRLYQAEYVEVWDAWCGESGRDNFEYSDFRLIVGRLDWLAQFIEAYQLKLPTRKYVELRERQLTRFDRNHTVLRQAASSYPWDPKSWYYPTGDLRPFQPEEKQALCEALRLENYTMENPQP